MHFINNMPMPSQDIYSYKQTTFVQFYRAQPPFGEKLQWRNAPYDFTATFFGRRTGR
jgi:hypothetical protein